MEKKITLLFLIACICGLLVAEVLIPPGNLTGSANGLTVTLNWDTPEHPFTHGNTFWGGIGGGYFAVAQRYTQAELANFGVSGMSIKKVGFVPFTSGSSNVPDINNLRVKFYVWTGVTANAASPGNWVARYPDNAYNENDPSTYVVYDATQSSRFQDITLPTPIPIPSTGEVWIGYSILKYGADGNTGYPAGWDNTESTSQNRNMLYIMDNEDAEENPLPPETEITNTPERWYAIYQWDLTKNWMVRGIATYTSGGGVPPEPVVFSHSGNGASSDISLPIREGYTPRISFMEATEAAKEVFRQSMAPTRAFTGYRVYRGVWGDPSHLEELTTNPITQTTYQNTVTTNNRVYTYHVTSITTNSPFESAPISVEVSVGSEPMIDEFPYVQTFDNVNKVFPPYLWRAFSGNAATADDWQLSDDPLDSASGFGVAMSTAYVYPTAYNPDEYLITPPFVAPTLANGESMFLTFKARNRIADPEYIGQYYPKFTVYKASTLSNPVSASDFTAIGDQYSLIDVLGWKEYVVNISSDITAGSTFYLAIRHHDSNNMDAIFLDDFWVGVAPTVNATFTAPVGLSANEAGSVVTLTWSAPTLQSTNLRGYKIYRDGQFVDSRLVTTLSFSENVIYNGTYTYDVTAVYQAPNGESAPVSTTAVVTAGTHYTFPITGVRHTYTPTGATYSTTLSWNAPEESSKTITHSGIRNNNYSYYNDAPNFSFAQRWDVNDLQQLGLNGGYIDSVGFHVYTLAPGVGNPPVYSQAWTSVKYTIQIFTDGEAVPSGEEPGEGPQWYIDPGNMVHTQEVDKIFLDPSSDWNDIKLNKLVQIPVNGELLIAVNIQATGFGERTVMNNMIDQGPWRDSKGDLIRLGNSGYFRSGDWDPTAPGGQQNVLLRANAFKTAENHPVVGAPTPQRTVFYSGYPMPRSTRERLHEITPTSKAQSFGIASTPPTRNTRTFALELPTGYRVMHGTNSATLTEVGRPTAPTVTINGLQGGAYLAEIYALYGLNTESAKTEYHHNVGDVTITNYPFEEGFEGLGFPPAGWNTRDTNAQPANGNWYRYVPVSNAQQGVAVAASSTYNTWLVTPKLSLPGNWTAASPLSFYYRRGGTGQESLQIRYNTTAADFGGTWEDLGQIISIGSSNWATITRNLPAFLAGQDVWVAFVNVNSNTTRVELDQIKITNPAVVADGDEILLLVPTALNSNYPNPFNPTTNISFSMQREGHVVLDVYNIKGQKVNTLVNEIRSAGHHSVVWNGKDTSGRDVSSGVYFYRMSAGNYEDVKKMILLK